jgi:hypothetical protein
MVFINSATIFKHIPLISPGDKEKDTENKKLSYWLEKLHIQGEKTRIDDNRREEQSNIRIKKKSQDEHSIAENAQTLTQQGINAQTKNKAAKTESDRQIVDDLVKKSNRNIISISSSFPWGIFPNTIYVEESRVTFRFNQFLSSQSHSVDIKDISNVFIESSMFFATLQVVSRTYVQNDIKIGNLNKAKALKVQRIIEGLRTFAENKINTSNYEIDELILKIGEFHNAHATG